jgi:hypothetical protein
MASEPEPRRLPKYDRIVATSWYCLHCEQSRHDANSLHVHVKSAHDIHNAHRGYDYADGSAVQLMIYQREEWEAMQPLLFAKHVDSLAGADDFAFEVGEGAPIEKGNWRAK